ncbi:MAG TPA: hypothetical protein VMH83_04810 [Candidatus Acidoferrum sp.]|nr:hypothetical protein [Candidatus Acidoferrum sp.]
MSALITRFKYHQGLECGRVLTQLLLDCIRQHYRSQPLPTLLLPVPLHATRLRERGYNQSLLMARDLGRALAIPVATHALQRQRITPPQQGLSAPQRRRNLRGAFVLTEPLPQRRIALIDDVVTTMSTVNEIARVLQRGQASPPEIHVWCLARA